MTDPEAGVDDTFKRIGKLARKRRKERGLSADEVARAIGRDRLSVYRFEQGRQELRGGALAGLVRLGLLTAEEALGIEAA